LLPGTNYKTTILNTKTKKILLLFAAILLVVSGNAQRTADIGIWGGTSNYFGDIDGNKLFNTFNPNFGAFYRYNFNSRVAVRAQFTTGNFNAVGQIENVPDSFSKSVHDFSVQTEINYLKYILGNRNTPFTSYVLAGFALTAFQYDADTLIIDQINPYYDKNQILSEFTISPALAFGIGFKYSIGQRLGIGIEYQMRKLFTDKLDDLDDPLSYEKDVNGDGIKEVVKYTDNLHNNDWTSYLGLHVTYKIYTGKKACPAYDSKN
jgi:hypothetical protein